MRSILHNMDVFLGDLELDYFDNLTDCRYTFISDLCFLNPIIIHFYHFVVPSTVQTACAVVLRVNTHYFTNRLKGQFPMLDCFRFRC